MVYDQLGEQGLKDRPPPENESTSGFSSRSAEDIFAEFFGSSPLNFGSSGPGRSKRFPSDGGAGGGAFSGFSGNDFNFRTHSERATMPKKPPPVETKLACSLEELYSGSKRKMKISRTIMDAYGYVHSSNLDPLRRYYTGVYQSQRIHLTYVFGSSTAQCTSITTVEDPNPSYLKMQIFYN